MLDAMASGAAVFEPEEVKVLSTALGLAMHIWHKKHPTVPDRRAEMGTLVHNLGRSRIKHNKKLSDGADAVSLAEEAADLCEYLDGRPDLQMNGVQAYGSRPPALFSSAMRKPPASELPIG